MSSQGNAAVVGFPIRDLSITIVGAALKHDWGRGRKSTDLVQILVQIYIAVTVEVEFEIEIRGGVQSVGNLPHVRHAVGIGVPTGGTGCERGRQHAREFARD